MRGNTEGRLRTGAPPICAAAGGARGLPGSDSPRRKASGLAQNRAAQAASRQKKGLHKITLPAQYRAGSVSHPVALCRGRSFAPGIEQNGQGHGDRDGQDDAEAAGQALHDGNADVVGVDNLPVGRL